MGTVFFGAHENNNEEFNPIITITVGGREITFTSDVIVKGKRDAFLFSKEIQAILSGKRGTKDMCEFKNGIPQDVAKDFYKPAPSVEQ